MTDVPKATDGGCDGETTSGKARSTKDLLGSKSNPYMIRHLFVSASYESSYVLSQADVSYVLKELVKADDGEWVTGKVYQTAHFIHPQHTSLFDAWFSLTDDERTALSDALPRLAMAIYLAVRGTVPDLPGCDNRSKSGSLCDRKGTHDVHMGPSGHVLDGMETTEVWT